MGTVETSTSVGHIPRAVSGSYATQTETAETVKPEG
jgi:hypothetical protein